MEFYATFVKPFIETVLQNLEDRFPEDDVTVISAADNIDESTALYGYGRNEITTLAEHYKLEKEALVSEWNDFNDNLLRYNNADAVLSSLVKCKDLFPNLFHIATHLLVVPMHSADCERGFSAMARIKNKLRSRLTNQTLNSLMFISIEGPDIQNFDFKTVLNKWARICNRRLFQGVPSTSKRSCGIQVSSTQAESDSRDDDTSSDSEST